LNRKARKERKEIKNKVKSLALFASLSDRRERAVQGLSLPYFLFPLFPVLGLCGF
jgi:hypothetical protein